jgi:hypothetical protein
MRSFDVKSAFLHSDLPATDRKTYIRLPVVTGWALSGHYAELIKSLYGLRQAPMLWNENIDGVLRGFGLTPTVSDPCLYTMQRGGETLHVSLHVDDMLCVGTSEAVILELRTALESAYGEVSESDGSSHLGLSIVRDELTGAIRITQPALLQKLFALLEIPANAHARTPYLSEEAAGADDDVPLEPALLQTAVGIANYLTHSRPDIRYAVSALSSHLKQPTQRNWRQAQAMGVYLRSTAALGVTYHRGGRVELQGYADASYATASEARSQSGLAFKLDPASGVVLSQSMVQTIVALSSTEAEYDTLSKATTAAIALRDLLQELGYECPEPTSLFEDNKSTIALTESAGNWGRSRHYQVRYNFVKLAIKDRVIRMEYIPTHLQLADIFTKVLAWQVFEPLRDALLGIVPFYS